MTKRNKPTASRPASPRIARGARAWSDGHVAEYAAALVLLLKGYRILGFRERTPFGEVDLLAAKKDTLIAVEVKLRVDEITAATAIQPMQQQRLINALHFLAARTAKNEYNVLRCDAMLFNRMNPLPRHIKNAFGG